MSDEDARSLNSADVLNPQNRKVFFDATDDLLMSPSKDTKGNYAPWLDLYRNSADFRSVVDNTDNASLAVYFICRARTIALATTEDTVQANNLLNFAADAISTIVAVKAFQSTRAEQGSPDDTAMLTLVADLSQFPKDRASAVAIRDLWHIQTPPVADDGQNEQLRSFLKIYEDKARKESMKAVGPKSEPVPLAGKEFAVQSDRVSDTALDMLYNFDIPTGRTDIHYYNRGVGFGHRRISVLNELMFPNEITWDKLLDDKSLLSRGAATQLLNWARGLSEEKISALELSANERDRDVAIFIRFIEDLDYINDGPIDAKDLVTERYERVDGFTVKETDYLTLLLERIQEPPETGIIPLLIDIDRDAVSQARASWLLTHSEVQAVNAKLIENRLENDHPNTTEDVLRIMQEVAEARTSIDSAVESILI